MLATQNPVDLDYKGLSNAGTWLIGRLQTERDKMRVLEGLESALAGAGNYDRGTLDKMISGITQRVFLMRNVHEDAPVLFKSRWALVVSARPVDGSGDLEADGGPQGWRTARNARRSAAASQHAAAAADRQLPRLRAPACPPASRNISLPPSLATAPSPTVP